RIVAWSIALGHPGKQQTTFFNERLGGESEAQLTILNPRSRLRSRAVAQGEPQKLTKYFGSTAQFALRRSIRVRKGWVVALTVPTWAPALAVGLGPDTSWRASRARGKCDDTQAQTSQLRPNQLAQYFCLYRTARLTYSATLIPDPVAPPPTTATSTTGTATTTTGGAVTPTQAPATPTQAQPQAPAQTQAPSGQGTGGAGGATTGGANTTGGAGDFNEFCQQNPGACPGN
ncbi:MAG: hypothetical protein QOD81_40, partial [Solirubrobacteraceae bacterium]|nr:hypothetical protein [Solirubrobacteraceae bacterium]